METRSFFFYNFRMEKTVRDHALLYAYLCRERLSTLDHDTAESLIDEATFDYGKSRGQRMRRHAEEAGLKADINAYMICGELKLDPSANRSSLSVTEDSTVSCVMQCAWHSTWEKENLLPCGKYYCRMIDKGITAGFSDELHLEVPETLGISSDRCIFVWDQKADQGYIAAEKKKFNGAYVRTYEQHMGELLSCFRDIISEHGYDEEIISRALQAYNMHTGEDENG